jgi:RNA polymerase sigma factor (sigma-70 family)
VVSQLPGNNCSWITQPWLSVMRSAAKGAALSVGQIPSEYAILSSFSYSRVGNAGLNRKSRKASPSVARLPFFVLKSVELAREQLVHELLEPQHLLMTESAPDSLPTRHSLLERIKDLGDDASWREFFELYWELIYNLARKTGLTDTEAQEVVQETLIGVSKRIVGFKTGAENGSFKAWLLQQTRWRIADQFRKRDKFSIHGGSAVDNYGPTASDADEATGTATVNRIGDPASLELDKAWDAEWEKHMLRLALERVKAQATAKQFQMFDLHALQGLSAKETARALGASVVAIHMATSRLRRLLKREITRLERTRGSI